MRSLFVLFSFIATSVFLSMLTVVSVNAAEVYTWVDEEGIDNFADATDEEDAVLMDLNVSKYDPSNIPEAEEEDPKLAKQRRNCANSQKNLDALEQYEEIIKIDSAGNEFTLDEAEKAAQVLKEQRYQETFCADLEPASEG